MIPIKNKEVNLDELQLEMEESQGTYIKRTTNCGNDSSSEIGTGDNRHLLVPFFNGLSHRISERNDPL